MNDKLIILLVSLLYFSPAIYQLFLLLKERKDENRELLKKLLQFSKYSFLILIFTSIVFGILSHTNFLNYEKPLTFDKYDQITFQNFRGLEFFKKSLYGNERFAYVVTSIDSDIDDNSVTVQSLFHPSRSFVYKKNTNSKELLNHEKYHIKITELFARKAKEKISDLNTFDKDKIEEIIREVKTKERTFQKEYDYNTFHSYVLSEQKRYEKEVDSLLTLLNKYKKPKITINDKN
ncbi:hypothetical protein CJ739_2193 [Mariniflexile rhizosphaerae]|uniref:hypothetical protein n=1 Tax=unclassified Mariniflexile TaxID=2643887 RepID=UPI000CC9227C|nr:hypothetical protein [Mariniflexile sp. TRM1-10]AXP81274.1 hypothetical protein CJ739_2193 [Mariniflexile sp. TRM1-10]PLB18112.1 MAG: Secreted protein [Flavobacteriaceae bacterium FS1-H7996/R]